MVEGLEDDHHEAEARAKETTWKMEVTDEVPTQELEVNTQMVTIDFKTSEEFRNTAENFL